MRFVGTVFSSLVSGSYNIGGGAGDIDALKTGQSTLHSVRTSQRKHRAYSKTRSIYLLWGGE
jgi:hypothetical protein